MPRWMLESGVIRWPILVRMGWDSGNYFMGRHLQDLAQWPRRRR